MIELLSAPRITYDFKCYDKHGRLKWEEVTENLVTTIGKTDLMDKYLAGSAYSATWFMALIDNAGYSAIVVADTMGSHTGWAESSAYSEAARPAVSWNAASGGVKAASAACVFTINASVTIKGAFMPSITTKGGTTGILYSASAFAANRILVNLDVLRVTPTMTIT